jgi:hypothetical protein
MGCAGLIGVMTHDKSAIFDIVDIFDGKTWTWTTARLSVARAFLSATSLPSKGLAIFAGGVNGAMQGPCSCRNSTVLMRLDRRLWNFAHCGHLRRSDEDVVDCAAERWPCCTYSDVAAVTRTGAICRRFPRWCVATV